MTRDEVNQLVEQILPNPIVGEDSYQCDCRDDLKKAISSMLWIARSEEDINQFLEDRICNHFDTQEQLAHSLFEWLRGMNE